MAVRRENEMKLNSMSGTRWSAKRVARLKRPAGTKPIGTWRRHCGYCGQVTQVVTDGRMLLCSACGH